MISKTFFKYSPAPTTSLDSSQILDYFENTIKDFIIRILSSTNNWENACISADIRKDADARYAQARDMDNVLNKPDYVMMDFVNFDAYEKIITRRDNWQTYFAGVFLLKHVFAYKMDIIRSLRNDIRHGRSLDPVNEIRLRLHCYDILSQIYESDTSKRFQRKRLARKLNLI